MGKVTWTDAAIKDLNDIGSYIAKDSERYAQIIVNKLFESVNILETYPLSGKIVSEFKSQSIRKLIRGNYKIVYKVIDDTRIDILTVHNCRRLLENTFDFFEG